MNNRWNSHKLCHLARFCVAANRCRENLFWVLRFFLNSASQIYYLSSKVSFDLTIMDQNAWCHLLVLDLTCVIETWTSDFQCKVKREFTPNVNIFYALSKQRLQKSSIVLIIIFVWTVSHIIAMIKYQNNHAYIDDTRYKLVLYM